MLTYVYTYRANCGLEPRWSQKKNIALRSSMRECTLQDHGLDQEPAKTGRVHVYMV